MRRFFPKDILLLARLLAAAGALLWLAIGGPASPPLVALALTFLLATSALIIEVNGGRHDLLGGGFRAEDARATLASAWRSGDRASVRRTLVWLENEGDRHRWEAMLQAFEEGDPELEDAAFANPALRAELEVINRYGHRHRSLVGQRVGQGHAEAIRIRGQGRLHPSQRADAVDH